VPIISFTERDLLRGKVIEPGWYIVKIESIGEAPSKDGGSTNYPVEGTVIKNATTGDTKFAGVPIEWNFNSKAIGFVRGFLESFNVSLQPGQRFELGNAAGKSLRVFIENDTWQQRIVNRVNHKYAPLDAPTEPTDK
jgi:hypothetical protein